MLNTVMNTAVTAATECLGKAVATLSMRETKLVGGGVAMVLGGTCMAGPVGTAIGLGCAAVVAGLDSAGLISPGRSQLG